MFWSHFAPLKQIMQQLLIQPIPLRPNQQFTEMPRVWEEPKIFHLLLILNITQQDVGM